jgi:hypothetical protein
LVILIVIVARPITLRWRLNVGTDTAIEIAGLELYFLANERLVVILEAKLISIVGGDGDNTDGIAWFDITAR